MGTDDKQRMMEQLAMMGGTRTDKANGKGNKVCLAFLLFIFYPTIPLITHQEHDSTRTTPLLPPHCHN
jgi:hypothetical protein